ncbi:unnamed protein product [Clonostachys byssicola]|uniref:N-acetyltransferase domain-containing protein n=1 Tax=Clonostachys byssicola TaxID=160290 RepID=A0A9N9U8B6_9HYPO|nr:unnamed protein product [Clonostachys byssicola]
MLIRKATRADIGDMARVAVASYANDPQDTYMYPRRLEHPKRYLKLKSDIIEHAFEDPTTVPIVAVLDDQEPDWQGTPVITGFCVWYCESNVGRDSEGAENSTRETKSSILKDSDIVDFLSDSLNPIVSSSNTRSVAQHCSNPTSRRFLAGYEQPSSYYGVYDIGVSPKFQRRGVARQLMNWGIAKADQEALPVYLSATPAGKPLYERLGFRTVGYWTWRPQQGSEWDIMQRDHNAPVERGEKQNSQDC